MGKPILTEIFDMRIEDLEIPFSRLYLYAEKHRFYHTLDHVLEICGLLDERGLLYHNTLFLAAIYHDIVYNPKSRTNEEDSVKVFLEDAPYLDITDVERDEVVRIITDTKTHTPTSKLSAIFCELDLNILTRPLDELIKYEEKIFKEFEFVDWKTYKVERIKVLEKLEKRVDNTDLQNLIKYIETRKPKIGLYAGSFNPFHKGHYNILEKAEAIFDKVILAQGHNIEKAKPTFEFPKGLEYRQCETYSGLLTEFIKELGYDVTLIRGLRNTTDLQYELTQYRYFQDMLPEIKTVSILCDKEFEHISSSSIRNLMKYGTDEFRKYILD